MPYSTDFQIRKYRRVPWTLRAKCPLVTSKVVHDFSRCSHLLVIIHPFAIRALELDLSERRSTLDSHALPDPLEDKGVNFEGSGRQQQTDGLPTLGSKLVNSRPLHSIMMKGRNCPLASAGYGCGEPGGSNLAELSRLQWPHFQTKWAVLSLPWLTWCTS